jgi:hypothetical protein
LVPGAGQFSNPLFANLDEFKALRESLKREGIFDETWETLVIPVEALLLPSHTVLKPY